MEYDYCGDDYCGCCKTETDYATTYFCTICQKFICSNCMKLFERGTLYTICSNKKCMDIHDILNILFNKDIAITIALLINN